MDTRKTVARTVARGENKDVWSEEPRNGSLGSGMRCRKAGDRIRTDDVQLGKLAFYH